MKAKIYEAMIRPVALDSSKFWPAKITHTSLFNTTDMRILRWSTGLTHVDHMTNEEVKPP